MFISKVVRPNLLRFLDSEVALQFSQRIRSRTDIAHDDAALNDGNPAADFGDVVEIVAGDDKRSIGGLVEGFQHVLEADLARRIEIGEGLV